jgi:hypothetical protein
MKRLTLLLLCAALACSEKAAVAAATVSHVVQISLDGLGGTYLQFYVTNAPAQFPNFVRLMNESAFTMNARCDFDVSETVPNHASMFMARPVLQPSGMSNTAHHGYNNNFPGSGDTFHLSGNPNVPYKFSMFDVAHDYGRTTAFYAGKTRLALCERSYNETNGAVDIVAEGGDNGRDKIDVSSVLDISGQNISNQINAVIADLAGPTPKHYTFIHLAEPDLTGHGSGWGSINYSNMVRAVDRQLGRLLDTLSTNVTLASNAALIVTADHGGGGGGTGNSHTLASHRLNYTIPFFLKAPGIPGGVDLYTLFTNRGSPGTNRTDYSTNPQPIRNGDGSNLALSLLGLPPIPGSFFVPVLKSTEVALRVARFEGQVSLFWADANAEYQLQVADEVDSTNWQTVSAGITTNETTRVYTVPDVNTAARQFFRLRKAQ